MTIRHVHRASAWKQRSKLLRYCKTMRNRSMCRIIWIYLLICQGAFVQLPPTMLLAYTRLQSWRYCTSRPTLDGYYSTLHQQAEQTRQNCRFLLAKSEFCIAKSRFRSSNNVNNATCSSMLAPALTYKGTEKPLLPILMLPKSFPPLKKQNLFYFVNSDKLSSLSATPR